jgi:pimeloyl-ACP methyl ester carboxylesterase
VPPVLKPVAILTAAACCLVPGSVCAADEVFDSNGVKIRYVSVGTGEAVVLIHGWMGDADTWGLSRSGDAKPNATGADAFHRIALDCRGHGKSDKPHDADKYDAEVAEDVVRLLDHLKVKKAHLLGYSSGAYVAGKVAATHPDRVRSVVFGGQAPIIGEVKESDFSEVELFARLVDDGKDLGGYVRGVYPGGDKLTDEQARKIAKVMYAGKDVKAFAAAGRGYKKLAVTTDELKKCQAPMLFIHGGNESEFVKNKVAAARKALGKGELKVIEGGDHVTTIGKPEFSATVIEFLKTGKVK